MSKFSEPFDSESMQSRISNSPLCPKCGNRSSYVACGKSYHCGECNASVEPIEEVQLLRTRIVELEALLAGARLLNSWGPPNYGTPVESINRINELEAAIRKHRDMRGDDKCFQDDAELYGILTEGDTRPERDTAVTIENCQRYIECRQQGRDYVSPQRRIEELEAKVDADYHRRMAEMDKVVQDRFQLKMRIEELEAKIRSEEIEIVPLDDAYEDDHHDADEN